MSVKILAAPRRYVQGPGALAQLGSQLRVFGIQNPLILASPSALKACRETIEQSFNAAHVRFAFVEFGRECTFKEIKRVKEVCLEGNHDAIVSCGGGKAMDTGRAAAAGFAFNVGVSPPEAIERLGANVPCVQVPTVAASDAATASLSVIYNDHGEEETTVLIRVNPTMVLADTTVIAQAPVRSLVAGMGDALATYFEADVVHRAGVPAITGG
ncbi:MAG: iron-containing alcohol dehydrogenase, partial [Deltaproteobacteria bacterium]|nr:iron-containing alcohol dehydrogenase [Deltaproteobacteria bacterium]